MDNKYTELEKWKKLKDSGDITEEEFNEEKQKILNSKETHQTNAPNKKSRKPIVILIIAIVVIGVIAAICISLKLKDNIQYERIAITTNEGVTLQVNKTNLDKGIAEIEKQKSVANTIGIVYNRNDIMYYLVATFDSSQDEAKSAYDYYMVGSENIRKYSISSIADDSGIATEGCPYVTKSAYMYMPISLYDIEDTFYWAGSYLLDSWELLVINYDNGNIKILNDQTNRIKTSREEDKNLSKFEKAMKYGWISNEYKDGISKKQLKDLYDSGNLQVLYGSWEECLEDVKKANLLTANTLSGKTYKGNHSYYGTITLTFIDDSTVKIDYSNSEPTNKCNYVLYGKTIEISEEDGASYYEMLDNGTIEFNGTVFTEVK